MDIVSRYQDNPCETTHHRKEKQNHDDGLGRTYPSSSTTVFFLYLPVSSTCHRHHHVDEILLNGVERSLGFHWASSFPFSLFMSPVVAAVVTTTNSYLLLHNPLRSVPNYGKGNKEQREMFLDDSCVVLFFTGVCLCYGRTSTAGKRWSPWVYWKYRNWYPPPPWFPPM